MLKRKSTTEHQISWSICFGCCCRLFFMDHKPAVCLECRLSVLVELCASCGWHFLCLLLLLNAASLVCSATIQIPCFCTCFLDNRHLKGWFWLLNACPWPELHSHLKLFGSTWEFFELSRNLVSPNNNGLIMARSVNSKLTDCVELVLATGGQLTINWFLLFGQSNRPKQEELYCSVSQIKPCPVFSFQRKIFIQSLYFIRTTRTVWDWGWNEQTCTSGQRGVGVTSCSCSRATEELISRFV